MVITLRGSSWFGVGIRLILVPLGGESNITLAQSGQATESAWRLLFRRRVPSMGHFDRDRFLFEELRDVGYRPTGFVRSVVRNLASYLDGVARKFFMAAVPFDVPSGRQHEVELILYGNGPPEISVLQKARLGGTSECHPRATTLVPAHVSRKVIVNGRCVGGNEGDLRVAGFVDAANTRMCLWIDPEPMPGLHAGVVGVVDLGGHRKARCANGIG